MSGKFLKIAAVTLFACALIGAGLAGCSKKPTSNQANPSASGSENTDKPLPVFKVAAADWLYVAQEKGWLDALTKTGVKVELVQGTLGNEAQLLARNDLHVARRMLYPALLYKSQGADITIVGVSKHPEQKIASIIVPADSPIKTFSDLKGKKIASWRAGCPYMVLFEQAENQGWKEGKDWTYLNIPSSENKTILLSKQVDAISVHPYGDLAAILVDGSAREIAYPKEDSVYVQGGGVTVGFTSTKFAKEHPNILKKYLELEATTWKWIANNQDEAAGIVEKVTRTPAKFTKFGWDRNKATWTPEDDLAKIKKETEVTQDWLIEHGDIDKSKKVDIENFFDKSFFK